jgi:hypothetical protein
MMTTQRHRGKEMLARTDTGKMEQRRRICDTAQKKFRDS